jgi:hypothetical protein
MIFKNEANPPNARLRKIIGVGIGLFLMIVAGEQIRKYFLLQNYIGMYAYSFPYALRIIGQQGEFVGRVIDVHWNNTPFDSDDIRGFQPRFLIARETIAGTTETRWLCVYLVNCATPAPVNYQPSPFPKITYEAIASQ